MSNKEKIEKIEEIVREYENGSDKEITFDYILDSIDKICKEDCEC